MGGITALDGSEWSASGPCRFPPVPGTHYIGGWVGPRASMDVKEKEKNLLPLLGIEPNSSAVQPIA
jgi:hypothetical protein